VLAASDWMNVNFTHPANAGILRHLERRGRGGRAPASCSPEALANPYFNLGTHPDLVQRLCDELGAGLPPCAWVVHGTPALVHPATGVLFAFAQGIGPYALRLPPRERAEALAAARKKTEEGADRLRLSGADRERYVARHTGRVWEYPGGQVLDLDELGAEWVFGRWLDGEGGWCRSAFDFAGLELAAG
jgi:hypothetical protein